MKSFLAMIVFSNLLIYQALPQATTPQSTKTESKVQTGDISTHGGCSPVAVTSTGPITIQCNTVGLTKAQIEQQRKQYAAILNSIRESGLKEEQILELVREIAKGMNQISETTKRRSLTDEQRRYLISKLKVVSDTNLLIDVQAGEDDRLYAQYFIDLFQVDLKWKSAHTRLGLEEVPTTGVYFIVSKEDNDAHTVPDGCVLTGEGLNELHLIDGVLEAREGEPVAPKRGTCTLYISRRKIPAQQ